MNEHLLYLASTSVTAFTCLMACAWLLTLKPLRDSAIPKYRAACKFLALAAGLVAVGHFAILSQGADEWTIMELFYLPVMLISSSQALLFTFLLILLFRAKSVTRENVLLHAAPTLVLTGLYLVACLFWDDIHTYRFDTWWDSLGNPPLLIRSLLALTYLIQLGIYTRLFFKERAIYLGQLRQVSGSHERLELRWVTRAFLWALAVGIAAMSLCFFPDNHYNTAINLVFSIFYPLVSIHYANYHYTYEQLSGRLNLAPATNDPVPSPKVRDLEDLVGELIAVEGDNLFLQAQQYMSSDSPYLNPDFSRNDLIRALGTNEQYLSQAIKGKLGITLKEYIDRYRVSQARTDLLMPGDHRTMEEIATVSGFANARSLSRAFQKVLGVTPAQYRAETRRSIPSPLGEGKGGVSYS